MKKARARRQRIPAFGEWNYDYGGVAGDWPVTQYFDSAMQAGLFMAIPPSPKPAKKVVNKWSESASSLEDPEDEKKNKQQQEVAVGLTDDHDAALKEQGKQSRVADAGVHHTSSSYNNNNNNKACRVAAVVKAVDQDLYHIPPDMLFCHDQPSKGRRLRRRRRSSSLWMGCLGLSCVA